MARRILTIEDDAAIRRGIVDTLRFTGYEVHEAADAPEGAEMAITLDVDLVLLDLVLPSGDGFDVLTKIRKVKPQLPVIVLTARGEEDDRVRGLSDGADDYVIKPFSVRELLARVEAVLRRSAERTGDVTQLTFGQVTVDLKRNEVVRPDHRAELSQREAELLRYLAVSRDRAISRDELLQNVWGIDPRGGQTRTIDMHVARLREKLGDTDGTMIVTVHGKGYMLTETK
ncbi:MAG: response regulator transcription factor [Planctomycetia bacterium]|jgi:DNA-binding response OmpR family regulator